MRGSGMDAGMRSALEEGNLERTRWPSADDHHNLYLGSGRLGASFGRFGLMERGRHPSEAGTVGATVLIHAHQWFRGRHGIDGYVPLAHVAWAELPPEPTEYRQRLDVVTGQLLTTLSGPNGRVEVRVGFDPSRPDVMDVGFEWSGSIPPVAIVPLRRGVGPYEEDVEIGVEWEPEGPRASAWTSVIQGRTTRVQVRVFGDATLARTEDGVEATFSNSGRALIQVVVGNPDEAARVVDLDARWDEIADAWADRWGDAYIHLPDRRLQGLAVRAIYHILASYAPDVRCPVMPCGWAGNNWPFPFPQDLSYIHPALLRLGHLDIAKAWVEFFHSRIAATEANTRRIYGAEGTMWAWEHPIGDDFTLFPAGVAPNHFGYEIHNAAYPARMAFETAAHMGDDA